MYVVLLGLGLMAFLWGFDSAATAGRCGFGWKGQHTYCCSRDTPGFPQQHVRYTAANSVPVTDAV